LRCPQCRTRRKDYALFLRHVAETKHAVCNCGGYHYPHRPASPYCEGNPLSALLLAERHGAEPEDLRRCAQHLIAEHPTHADKVRDLLIFALRNA